MLVSCTKLPVSAMWGRLEVCSMAQIKTTHENAKKEEGK
jgi:hypothetical protein